MELKLSQEFLTENDCYQAGRKIVPKGIMVHSTGVAQPDPQVFIRRWNKPGVEVCVHAFVARDEVIQTLPWNWRGWHAGSGKNGSANNTHISFECCEPAGHTYQNGKMVGYDVEKNEAYFQDIYRNAVELSAMLCRQYRLDPMEPGVILDHAGGHALGIASNHSDVGQWWPLHRKTMDDFRRAVRDAMRGGEETVTQEQFDAMMADYLARRGREKPSDWSENARPLGGGGRTGLRGQRWDALSGLHHPGGDHPVPLPLPAGDGREAITEKEPPPPEEPAEGASGHGVAQALQSP